MSIGLTFRHNAFHTNQVTKVTRRDGAWGDMFSSKASLEADMEFFKLLPIGVIKGQDVLTHSSLKG